MRILISNDDGINAQGLDILVQTLSKEHEVYVVAPDSQRSANAQALTIRDKILVNKIENSTCGAIKVFSISGTPTDCVKLAITTLLEKNELPDIVISGINHGPNLGYDVCYSGTVAAALEAARLGFKAIAVSIVAKEWTREDFIYPAKFVSKFIKNYPDIESKTVFNINIPKLDEYAIKNVVYTHLADRVFTSEYKKISDNGMREEYLLVGVPAMDTQTGMTDIQAVRLGKISITPLNYDMTDKDALYQLSATVQLNNL